MNLTTLLLPLLCAPVSSAFADEPKAPAAPSPAVQVAAPAAPEAPLAATPPVAAADAQAAAAAADGEKAKTEAEIKTMRARGYKPVSRNGTLVYCRAEGQLGTHFRQEHCSTLDQLKT